MISKKNRLFGAILLISGTTIGAAMLALPLTTGQAGFFPALFLMTGIWLYMMLTAFYLLEVNQRMPGESNIISMVHKTLGRPGEVMAWIIYLLLLYSLLSAYIVGCSAILSDFLQNVLPFGVPDWAWTLVIFILFASFVYFGTQVVDFFNRILMAGLALGYITLMGLGFFYVDFSLLAHSDWSFLIASTSVISVSFGYHIIIPTLTTYLEHDTRLLKWAIFIGSLIPFLIYFLWQSLVMGILPVDTLEEAAKEGHQVVFYLRRMIESPLVLLAAKAVSFFAIVTSLLGVSLSLSDFLADGLPIKKTHGGRLGIILLTFIPPLLFALFYPRGFILALHYAGIFVILLLALLPTLMAWFERYGPETERSFIKSDFKVPGGKVGIVGAFLLSLVLLAVEVLA